MAWVKVDDHFDEHPKFLKVGPLGIALWLTGLAYSNRTLTDGLVPEPIAKQKAWSYQPNTPDELIEKLVEAGLWKRVTGGFQIHDYEKYQLSKKEVLAERQRWSERKSRQRHGGNHVGTPPGNPTVSPSPPVPVPVPVPNPVPISDSKTQKRKTKTCPPTADVLEGFEEFYSEYPKKIKRPRAEAAWKRIKNRDPDAIMVGLGRWCEYWLTRDPQYTDHPATFLNNRMWEDNPPVSGNGAIPLSRKLAELGKHMKEKEISHEQG